MKIIKKDLVLTKDTTFTESIKVEGNISGRFNLKVEGNIVAWNINAGDIVAEDINAGDIDAGDIDAGDIVAVNIDAKDIDAWNIVAWNINAWNIVAKDIDAVDIDAYAFIVAYSAFKCNSWKCRRENGFAKCLDGEIETKQDKVCSKCGHKLK